MPFMLFSNSINTHTHTHTYEACSNEAHSGILHGEGIQVSKNSYYEC
jgi:hypothetical protein